MSICRTCGNPIMWVETSTGKRMPVDLNPTVRGNITLQRAGGKVYATVHASTAAAQLATEDPDVKTFISHFTTCPHARMHRRDPQ